MRFEKRGKGEERGEDGKRGPRPARRMRRGCAGTNFTAAARLRREDGGHRRQRSMLEAHCVGVSHARGVDGGDGDFPTPLGAGPASALSLCNLLKGRPGSPTLPLLMCRCGANAGSRPCPRVGSTRSHRQHSARGWLLASGRQRREDAPQTPLGPYSITTLPSFTFSRMAFRAARSDDAAAEPLPVPVPGPCRCRRCSIKSTGPGPSFICVARRCSRSG